MAHKHAVRQALHPQLCELWTHEPLRHKAGTWLDSAPDPSLPEAGVALREVAGHSFAVLVQARLKLVAELDILLLRPQAPGAIVQRADIDNRLKTLFDALRCPDTEQESVNVDTDRLLAPKSAEDVDLTIKVQLRASSPTYASVMLIS